MSILDRLTSRQAALKNQVALTTARHKALTQPTSTALKSRAECLAILDRLEKTTGKRSSLNRGQTSTRSEIIAAIQEVEALMRNPIIAASIPDDEVARMERRYQNITKPITPAKVTPKATAPRIATKPATTATTATEPHKGSFKPTPQHKLTREAFNALSARDKVRFAQQGGKLTTDAAQANASFQVTVRPELSREAFNALTPADRTRFAKEGGKLTN